VRVGGHCSKAYMDTFDVWTDSERHVTATPATAAFVDHSDAPYGFCTHAIRIDAVSGREAIKFYRAQAKITAVRHGC